MGTDAIKHGEKVAAVLAANRHANQTRLIVLLSPVGCLMFLAALLRSTRHAPTATSTPETARAVIESR